MADALALGGDEGRDKLPLALGGDEGRDKLR